jgi:hypothetical protein
MDDDQEKGGHLPPQEDLPSEYSAVLGVSFLRSDTPNALIPLGRLRRLYLYPKQAGIFCIQITQP